MVDAASEAQSPNTNVKDKVSLNPFKHLAIGIRQFFKVNAGQGLLAIAVASLANLIMVAALMATLFTSFSDIVSPTGQNIASFFIKICVASIVVALVTGYFSSVVSRIIIVSVRGQKESLSTAMKLVWQRLPKIALTYLAIIGIIFLAGVVLGLTSAAVPIVGALLSLVALIAGIIWALRLVYISLVLVDQEEITGPTQVFKRSASLWQRSGGAIILYMLVGIVAYLILSALSGGLSPNNSSSSYNSSYFSDTSTTATLDTDESATTNDDTADAQAAFDQFKETSGLSDKTGFVALLGAWFVSIFVGNLFSALGNMGMASIYNDARKLVGGKPSASGAAAAPVAPTA